VNISVKSSYALHAVFDLAAQPPEQLVKIAEIAKRQQIPQKFLEHILASLKQGGFVESRRGAEGGYRLTKGADQLTVGQVLRFVEPPKQRRDCDGPFTDLWKRLDASADQVLDSTTFAEVVRRWKESRTRYVPNYEI
jgi:Rrf2 family transcriptional regulator, cysteine metabolism repressor